MAKKRKSQPPQPPPIPKPGQLLRILVASLIVTGALLIMPGCGTTGINDALITDGTSVGVSTYLGTISDSARCHSIANLASGIAGTLRTFTGNPPPTPDQLSAAIIAEIPQNLRTQYPEVVAFLVPLVVEGYQFAIQTYGSSNQQTVYRILADVATGVETGSSAGCH